MGIGTNRKKLGTNPYCNMGPTRLTFVEHEKVPVLVVDTELKFKDHITSEKG